MTLGLKLVLKWWRDADSEFNTGAVVAKTELNELLRCAIAQASSRTMQLLLLNAETVRR